MDKILVLDFGGQYNQLIARRVREHKIFAEVKGYNGITLDEIMAAGYTGIIFTGGPNSVYDEQSPHFDPAILSAGIPVLGICYGCQLMAWMGNGEICSAGSISEYGKVTLHTQKSVLFDGVPESSVCWMSHTDYIKTPPEGFSITATTDNCPCAAMCDDERRLYGVQFHPEVTHTEFGAQILHNFLFKVCRCAGDWHMDSYCKTAIAGLREKIGDGKVLLALSGGVDSSVCAALLAEAIGSQLTCVFVDHGLMRLNEGDEVEQAFSKWNINFVRVDAADRFLAKLAGVTEPERKRKIIGEEFIRVFEEESKKIGSVDYLAQGTIYPDIIESGLGASATIKSHHNVGGLPDYLVSRQPFPGPGLAIRILGEITREKIATVQKADFIFREEMKNFGLDAVTSQFFAVLDSSLSVGVMGDARTYGGTIVLRAVTTDDFMTADWSRLPYDMLSKASNRITNEVPNVTRVVYDITSKPPATVEWE